MKAHIFQSPEPVKEGTTLIALCGVELQSPVYVYSWDAEFCPEFLSSLSTLSTCKSCYKVFLSQRYIYGVISREHLDEARRRAKIQIEDSVA